MAGPESPFLRVVGPAPELEKQTFKDAVGRLFHAADMATFPAEAQAEIARERIPLTPEQTQAIDICNEVTNAYLKKLGLPAADLPARNFVILPNASFGRMQMEPDVAATNALFQQVIFINQDVLEGEPLSYFAAVVLHEMIQFKGPFAWRISDNADAKKKDKGTGVRQWGLRVFDNVKDIPEEMAAGSRMEGLEEATVTDIQKLLFREVFNRAPFVKERKEMSQGRVKRMREQGASNNDIPIDEIYRISRAKTDDPILLRFPYYPQRVVLNEIAKDIKAAHPDQFKTIEDVKVEFHRARFTLNIQGISRLIRNTYGPQGLETIAAMSADEVMNLPRTVTLPKLQALRTAILDAQNQSKK